MPSLFANADAYQQAIIQVLVWILLPVLIGVFVSIKVQSVKIAISRGVRERTRDRHDGLVILTGLGLAFLGILVGVVYLALTSLARFSLEDIEKRTGALVVLAVGAVTTVVLLGYNGWFFGTRVAWTKRIPRKRQAISEPSPSSRAK